MKTHIVYGIGVLFLVLATSVVVYAATPDQKYDERFVENDWNRVVSEWTSLKHNGSLSAAELAPYEERFTAIAGVRYMHEVEKITLFYTRLRTKILNSSIDRSVRDRLLAYVDGEIVWYDKQEVFLQKTRTVDSLTARINEMSTRWLMSQQYNAIVSHEFSISSIKEILADMSSVAGDIAQSIDELDSQGYDVSSFQENRILLRRHIDRSYDGLNGAIEHNQSSDGDVQRYLEASAEEIQSGVQVSYTTVAQLREKFPTIVPTIIPGVPTGYPALMAP